MVRAFAMLLVVGLVTLGMSSFAVAADEPSEVQKKALAWLDDFAVQQVLFSPKDVEKLREKVAKMSPEEAVKWWDESAEERKLFEDPEWKKTRDWLKEFLKVQAIYSDEQIRYFQSEAFAKAKEGARPLAEVMDELTERRKELTTSARQSADIRKQLVASTEAYHQEAVREREFLLANAPRPTAPPVTSPIRNDSPVRYNRPLVTSLDVARWSIMQQLFPRW